MLDLDGLWRTWRMARDPLTALPDLAAEGDAIQMPNPMGGVVWVFHHPDAVHQVLVRDFRSFKKDVFTRRLDDVLGDGLLTAEGTDWKRHRRLMTPAFSKSALAGYAATMVARTEAAVDGWGEREAIDAHGFTAELTLDIVARTLFGADVGAQAGRIAGALDDYMHWYVGFLGSGFPLPEFVPTRANLGRQRALRVLDDAIGALIAGASPDAPTLLGRLTAARDEEGGLTPKQLRDEALTLLMAGHETTAGWLLFTLYALAQEPDVEERLHAELDTVLGGRAPTLDDVPRLTYTRQVLLETLRLFPPAWSVGREACVDIDVGGANVKAGDQVWIGQWSIHRDARWYADPLTFRPERWATLEKTLPKGAFLPFGAGPRICVGKRFAELEATLCLATIARRYSLRLVPGTTLELLPSVTLRPATAMPMVAHERRSALRAVA